MWQGLSALTTAIRTADVAVSRSQARAWLGQRSTTGAGAGAGAGADMAGVKEVFLAPRAIPGAALTAKTVGLVSLDNGGVFRKARLDRV